MTDRHLHTVRAETAPTPIVKDGPNDTDEMQSFLLVLRRALLLIVVYIETKYRIEGKRR